MLEDRALVLNRSWTAISTTSVRRAVVLLVRGAAGVVHPTTYQLHTWEQWLRRSSDALTEPADALADAAGVLDVPQLAAGDALVAELPRAHGRSGATSRSGRPGSPGRLLGFGLSICVPEVIALRTYDGYPVRGVAFTRRNVYKRDGHTCQYCGKRPGVDELTIDHVIPRSRGGPSSWENCVTACRPCNARKANRLAHELNLTLSRPPTAPRWPGGLDPASVRARPLWQRFLPASAVALTA